MADATVEDFLKKRQAKNSGDASASAGTGDSKPLLQMKKYVVPKVKSAGSESTDLNNS